MSLSTEALARLEDLDLQEARDGLSFSAAAEGGQSAGADLSSEELAGLRSWDLSGVLARLNSLTFEPPPAPMSETETETETETGAVLPPDGGARASTDEDELPDWLKPAEEIAPEVVAELPAELPEPSPRDQWNQLADDQRNKDFNIWAGNSPPSPAEAEEPADEPEEKEMEEELVEAAAGSLAGAVGKMRKFFESEKGRGVLAGAEFAAGGIVGVAIAEILKLDPASEAGIVIIAQSALGLSRLATELGARAVETAEVKFPRFARLSRSLAGEKGLAGVSRGVKTVATRIQYRPFVAGLSVGILGHSVFEMVTGHSIFADVNAAEPTPGPAADTETPTVTATETPTGTPTPEATPVSPEATQIPGGGQPPAEQVGPQHPGVGRLPEGEPAVTPPEDLLPQPEDALIVQQQQVEAARQAALESGKTIGELAESSGQVPWNVVRGMAGDGPHAGEVTNVVTRALQAGEIDISNLHEGAISQLVTKVQGLFDSADNALQTFNVGHPYAPRPYDAGGLGAVETVKGFNSQETWAIRAGNLGDMEAAGNLFNSVLKSLLSP